MGYFLIQLDGADGAHDFAGAASRAQRRGDDDLAQRAYFNGFFRAFGAVALPALLTDHRIINADFFNLNDFDPGPAAADFAGMKKRAVDLAAAAAGTFGKLKGNHSSTILSIR
jgi:hypothetical protein